MTSNEALAKDSEQELTPIPLLHSVEAPPVEIDSASKWSNLIKSASRFIWVGVVLIVILQLWGGFAVSNIKETDRSASKVVTVIIPQDRQPQISAEIEGVLGNALVSAQSSASKNLERWQIEMMENVDRPFLDWYYGYFTQLGIGAKAIWINLTTSSDETKAEQLIGEFQKEFTKSVLQPPLMQLKMERFTREAIGIYASKVKSGLAGVQSSYDVPQPDWEKYLENLGSMTYNAGGKEQDLSLRAFSRGTGYVATMGLTKVIGTIGTTKVIGAAASKAASKVATKIATKTAAKVLAEGGGMALGLVGLELINPIAGLGVLVYDVWEHNHTVKVERPIMRENLEKYLSEVKDSLLNDPANGILSSINKFHDGIMDNLDRKSLAIP